MKVLTTPIDIFEIEQPNNLNFNFDPLALSCCYHRVKTLGLISISTTIVDDKLSNLLNADDFEEANRIREYYSRKYFWKQLQKNSKLSKFRTEALAFIHSENPSNIPYETVKIVHKLPEFYQEDLILDKVKKGANLNFEDTNTHIPRTKTLTPKNWFFRRTKNEKLSHYWLWDEDNRLCNLQVEAHNSLEHLWLDIFKSYSKIKIRGYFFTKERDNFKYYTISNWTLEK